jgi:GAF domain-containing protein
MTDEAGRRVARLVRANQMLVDVSRRIGPALALDPVIRTVLDAMRGILDFRGGSIALVDARGLYLAATDPPVSPEVRAARVPVGQGITGRVVADGVSILVPDLDLDPRVDPELRRLGSNAGMVSYLAVPLVALGKVIGVLQVDAATAGAFDDDDRIVLEALAAQVAGAIESARAFERVAELEALKNRFTSRVTGDLSAPVDVLQRVLGELDGVDDPATGRRLLDEARAASNQVLALVESLITLSRLETAPLSVRPETVDLDDVLARVRLEVGAAATEGHGRGPQVRADPDLLARALVFAARSAARAGRATIRTGAGPVVDVIGEGGGDELGVSVARALLALQGGTVTAIPDGLRIDLSALAAAPPFSRQLLSVSDSYCLENSRRSSRCWRRSSQRIHWTATTAAAASPSSSPDAHSTPAPVFWSASAVPPQVRATRPYHPPASSSFEPRRATPRKAWKGTATSTYRSRSPCGIRRRSGSRPTAGQKNRQPATRKWTWTHSWTSGCRSEASKSGVKYRANIDPPNSTHATAGWVTAATGALCTMRSSVRCHGRLAACRARVTGAPSASRNGAAMPSARCWATCRLNSVSS